MTPAPGGLWGTHQFGVDQDGNLYTAKVWGGRPQKFVPRKGAAPALLAAGACGLDQVRRRRGKEDRS